MITYKYSLKYDLIWIWRNFSNRNWLKKKGLVVFKPSINRMIKLILKVPTAPSINIKKNITCYWMSSGTWGAYTPPDKIFICPHKNPNLEKVIRHEILHLEHESEVNGMSHQEKEKYINNLTNK